MDITEVATGRQVFERVCQCLVVCVCVWIGGFRGGVLCVCVCVWIGGSRGCVLCVSCVCVRVCVSTRASCPGAHERLCFPFSTIFLLTLPYTHIHTHVQTQVCALANGPFAPSLAWHPHALLLAYAAEGTGADVGGSGGLGPGSIGVPGGGFGSLVGGGGDRGRGLKEENVRVVSVLE